MPNITITVPGRFVLSFDLDDPPLEDSELFDLDDPLLEDGELVFITIDGKPAIAIDSQGPGYWPDGATWTRLDGIDTGWCSWCEEAESPVYLAHEGHDPECPFDPK